MSKQRALFMTVCAFAGAFGAASVQAASSDVKHFKIFAGPAYVAPVEEDDVTLGAVTDSLAAQEQVGWNLGFEGRFGKLLGIELDYINSNQDLEFGGTTIGNTNFSPVTATLNFHVISGEKFDFYLGPSYAYINWSDVQLSGGGELGTQSTHGWGASIGADFYPWEHFGFYAGLRYLDANLDLDNNQSASMNPVIARIGAAARF